MKTAKNSLVPIPLRLDGRSWDQINHIQSSLEDRFQSKPSRSVVIRRAIGFLSAHFDSLIQSGACEELENELYFMNSAASGEASPWRQPKDFSGLTEKSYRELVSEKTKADFERVFKGGNY